jgi:hypothetical protein
MIVTGEMMSSDSTLDNSALRSLYQYWGQKRQGRPMPARSDISPADIPRLLPNLMIVEAVPPARFRYRLVGSELVRRFGRDPTGQFADEVLEGSHGAFVNDVYTGVCQSCRPAMAESQYFDHNKIEFVCKRIVLPLSDGEGSEVRQLLILQTFEFGPAGPNGRLYQPKTKFGDLQIRDALFA